ncbi:GNAT family N-acetyltransferase [Streptomyces sp. NPDC020807]|uniref:GNAT family N-acetyltransferase n=1 Tax=Streptomyces sp. NPDC020807 TaxID=3155119 RepID=UPI00340DD458
MDPSVTLQVAATPSRPALVLRPWREEDIPALVEAYRDPALRRASSLVVDGEDSGLEWVRAEERGWTNGDRLAFAVLEEGADGEWGSVVGNVVLKGVTPGKTSAEVGYWTAAHARGRAVAPRALDALTAWAFDVFAGDGLTTLELLHQTDNPASCRVAEKTGFALDGILPASPPAYPNDGHVHVRRTGT